MKVLGLFALVCIVRNVQGEEQKFWAEDGCPTGTNLNGKVVGRWASDDEMHEVQCCTDRGVCVRTTDGSKTDALCFSSPTACLEDGETDLCDKKTYAEANAICEENNKRLCTKEEVLNPREHVCCGTGCWHDHVLVWTSTPSITTTVTTITGTTATTTTTATSTTTNTIIAALQNDVTGITKLLEEQIQKTESHVQTIQTQVANLVSQNVADKKDMKTYLAKIAQLEAQLALKIDKPSTLPFAEPLFSSCSKDGADCAPSVEASGSNMLSVNSCCGSVVINSKVCTVDPCDLLNDLNVVKDVLGI